MSEKPTVDLEDRFKVLWTDLSRKLDDKQLELARDYIGRANALYHAYLTQTGGWEYKTIVHFTAISRIARLMELLKRARAGKEFKVDSNEDLIEQFEYRSRELMRKLTGRDLGSTVFYN